MLGRDEMGGGLVAPVGVAAEEEVGKCADEGVVGPMWDDTPEEEASDRVRVKVGRAPGVVEVEEERSRFEVEAERGVEWL